MKWVQYLNLATSWTVLKDHQWGGATLPLWGVGGHKKKKIHQPNLYRNFNWALPMMYIRPPPIYVQFTPRLQLALVSIVGLFYPLIKQNMAHLYLNTQRHYQQNNTLSSIFKLKIRTLSFAILFILFLSSVYTPPPTPLVLAAPKQNKTLAQPSSQTQSSRSKKKKKNLTIIFFLLAFLK